MILLFGHHQFSITRSFKILLWTFVKSWEIQVYFQMFNYHQDLWQLFTYPSYIFVIIYYFSSNFLPVVVVVISSKSYDSSAKHSPCHCSVTSFKMLACVTIFVGVVIQGLRQHQQLGFINSCKFTESGMVGSDPIRYLTSIY